MTDAEKEPYLILGGKAAVLEQQRKFQIEFGEGYYILEDGSKSTDAKNSALTAKEQLEIRAKSSKTDPSLKHPPSAYKIFQSVCVTQLKKEGKPENRLFALAHKEWTRMTEDEKQPYVDEAAVSKAVFKYLKIQS